MSLGKAYEPSKYEDAVYQLWEKSGAFQPSDDPKAKPFCIIMPPPNANGHIHVGTAMFTLEDIMIRYRRMQGDAALWLPGTDHAGIETQVVFERELAKEGKDRFDFGPQKFYDALMSYTKEKRSTIISELKSMGYSADWTRLKFTLDPDIIDIVYGTFKRLHDDGLVYRGNRIVNWCTRCQSSFADIEVKYIERADSIYTLDYGLVKIATTRPETIFADVAVAVNPKDKRFAKLIGQTATVPFVNRPIPIIADDHVDPHFGTGALKVTPGHDPNDFDIGLRHDLPQINVIDTSGNLINVPEELLGLTVEEARTKTVELLSSTGQLISTEPLHHSVGIHGRCDTVIEPLITEQWWLKITELTQPAIQAITSGQIKVVPQAFTKTAIRWLENLHDWNISRQIWWGIRIPVYYKTSNDPDKQPYIIAKNEDEAEDYYGKGNFKAETDTFDTWFSSGQWPFATLMATGDYERFYPTTVMETGRDILFLWVTRMIILGLYRTGQIPFETIYLHGMVNDAQGKKMSKSRGNVINPLDITQKYGTDSLRLALTIGITPGNDGALGEKKVEGYRNFCNKLWNVARFITDKVGDSYTPSEPVPNSLADRWILDKLSQAIASITKDLDNFRFSDAGQKTYSLIWNDFADWYIEASKSSANPSVLVYGLEIVLKLLHPIAPFVTEAIWQELPWQKDNLITSHWPKAGTRYSKAASDFSHIMALVSEIRNLKAELRLANPTLLHRHEKLIETNQELIERLTGLKRFEAVKEGRGLVLPESQLDVWLDIDDAQLASYVATLKAQQQQKQRYRQQLEHQLSNQSFVVSAPPQVVEAARDRLAETQATITKINDQIEALNS
jgi:valyl-tRNA synthetase